MNELSTEVKKQQLPSAYGDIDGMMKFVESFGVSFSAMGLCGVKNAAEGKILALKCFIDRVDPFSVDNAYHIIGGKMSMKSDMMLAELRLHGGDYEWIDEGDVKGTDLGTMTGQAKIKIVYRGKENVVTYSMDDARRAKLVKPGGGWEKNPDAMLRARAVSKAGRMYFPEVLKGQYTPEEVEDFIEGEVIEKPIRTKEEVKSRAAEIRGESASQEKEVSDPAISDAEYTPVQSPAEPEVDNTGFDQVMIDLEETLEKANMKKESLEELLKKSRPDFTSLEGMTVDQLRVLGENLRKKLQTSN